jgi:hypothetical protein
MILPTTTSRQRRHSSRSGEPSLIALRTISTPCFWFVFGLDALKPLDRTQQGDAAARQDAFPRPRRGSHATRHRR